MLDHPENMHEDAAAASREQPADAAASLMAPLSDYVRHAADYTRELAEKLEGQKVDELVASAMTWTRKQPLLLVGGGIVLGFVLSQLVKSGTSGTARSPEESE
ncbi:MAG: hypothetical protein AB7F22_21015 [Reyranella sp.]|uniref:hypothetical protein n=1 Tax=Reyranella sp. TaxID=1929291 RepID=UPI003D0EE6F0